MHRRTDRLLNHGRCDGSSGSKCFIAIVVLLFQTLAGLGSFAILRVMTQRHHRERFVCLAARLSQSRMTWLTDKSTSVRIRKVAAAAAQTIRRNESQLFTIIFSSTANPNVNSVAQPFLSGLLHFSNRRAGLIGESW